MSDYAQFCSVARALELVEGRWTILIIRELLCGSTRFTAIHRGIPRISRTLLSDRLQELTDHGIVTRSSGHHGPEYSLTKAGAELLSVVSALGTWGQRWIPRHARSEVFDAEPVLIDMARRVQSAALPKAPLVARFEIRGNDPHFLLFKSGDAALCSTNPGFPEPLCIRTPLPALVTWWRGDGSFLDAQRMGLTLEGPRSLTRAFPTWFERYQFAGVKPVMR